MAKIKSEEFQLTKQDVVKWSKNALIFSAPALLVFLTQIQAGVPIDDAMSAVYLWLLNTLVDLVRKFIQENKY